ncbi:hypothetical protein CAPTEDRAFT_198356 [Capitella teleta]|uniref:Uncharacterized protein n=1 Tax=Capitella teleta TaxID=283909 RepID=R7UIR0_CAPTE|nr:hypothetical protein CAPTEDRAFT_198356 [Capitella teleta]|eukprot:ELU03167.1 hypothetical protein CAPTEDRAFT_198356 [Capitella teleta]
MAERSTKFDCYSMAAIFTLASNILGEQFPTYVRKLNAQKARKKTISVWNDDVAARLSGCFASTDLDMFVRNCSDINELSDTVTDYIKFCEEMIIEKKTIKIYPNNKPWITREVIEAARRKHQLWVSGNRHEAKRCQVELNDLIKRSKVVYRNKIERCFKENDSKSTWKGLKTITGYKKKPSNAGERNDNADVVWGQSCTKQEKKRVNRIERKANRTISYTTTPWKTTITTTIQKQANKIIREQHHPLKDNYSFMPSGRRLRLLKCNTTRYQNTFVPSSIRLINSS